MNKTPHNENQPNVVVQENSRKNQEEKQKEEISGSESPKLGAENTKKLPIPVKKNLPPAPAVKNFYFIFYFGKKKIQKKISPEPKGDHVS